MEESGRVADFQRKFDALCDGDLELLETFANEPDFPLGKDRWLKRHWLTNAVHAGNPDSLAWLLSKEPTVNYVDEEGYTALTSALEMETAFMPGRRADLPEGADLAIKLIDSLVDAGAQINYRATLGQTALHFAAMKSSVKVVRHLLQLGADPMIFDNEYLPRQPLHYAETVKQWDVCVVLKESMGNGSRN